MKNFYKNKRILVAGGTGLVGIQVIKILDELGKLNNVRIITNTTLFAYMHYNYLLAIQDLQPNKGIDKAKSIRQVVWKIRAKKVILATGSIERPLTFPNNDRPGIMLYSAVRKYANDYDV